MILRALEAGYEPISILMEKRQVEKKAGEVLKKVGDIPIYVADLSVLTQTPVFSWHGVCCVPCGASPCRRWRASVRGKDVSPF